ncbi:MAG: prolipoprotein diacylglyceryl transferase [Lentisphaeria bacterium]|nr:prolipoprotein diacylglyceryl transferase [Lentisphaeria bacterium]
MQPIALQIGSFAIRWYGVMAAVGFLLGSWVLFKNKKAAGLNDDTCSGVLLTAMIAGIAGARIFYVVQFFDHYRNNLISIIRIDQGGLVFYGGFLLAFVSIILYSRKTHLDPIRVLDVLSPAMALAHAFGRVGCYLNGCCFGKITSSFLGVTPPVGSVVEQLSGPYPVYQVQLSEAGQNILLAILYCYMLRHVKRGVVISCFLIFYGTLRFFNEMMRGDNVLFFHLTPAQWIGLLLVPAGLGLLFHFLRRDDKRI